MSHQIANFFHNIGFGGARKAEHTGGEPSDPECRGNRGCTEAADAERVRSNGYHFQTVGGDSQHQ